MLSNNSTLGGHVFGGVGRNLQVTHSTRCVRIREHGHCTLQVTTQASAARGPQETGAWAHCPNLGSREVRRHELAGDTLCPQCCEQGKPAPEPIPEGRVGVIWARQLEWAWQAGRGKSVGS